MVDLFLYRDPEEAEKPEEEGEAKVEEQAVVAQPQQQDQWNGAPAETSGAPVGAFQDFQAPAAGQQNWQQGGAPASWSDENTTAGGFQ